MLPSRLLTGDQPASGKDTSRLPSAFVLVKETSDDSRRRVAQLARERIELIPSLVGHPERPRLEAHATTEAGHAPGVLSVSASHGAASSAATRASASVA